MPSSRDLRSHRSPASSTCPPSLPSARAATRTCRRPDARPDVPPTPRTLARCRERHRSGCARAARCSCAARWVIRAAPARSPRGCWPRAARRPSPRRSRRLRSARCAGRAWRPRTSRVRLTRDDAVATMTDSTDATGLALAADCATRSTAAATIDALSHRPHVAGCRGASAIALWHPAAQLGAVVFLAAQCSLGLAAKWMAVRVRLRRRRLRRAGARRAKVGTSGRTISIARCAASACCRRTRQGATGIRALPWRAAG